MAPGPRVEIVNIVAAVRLDPLPDPKVILERIPDARPLKRFRGALIRIGRVPVLFYRRRIIVTGVTGTGELEDIIGKLVGILHRHGIRAEPRGYEVVNVTARAWLGRRINLAEAAEKLGGIYDPDYRPYLVARINDAVIMLTHNGKLVILGASSFHEIDVVVRRIVKLFDTSFSSIS